MTKRLAQERLAKLKKNNSWPEKYINKETGKTYLPHMDEEEQFITSDTPRYALLKGGEGAGKSVAGIIKTLEKLRRGASGLMVSPDLPHFRRSLWKEFRLWCPAEILLPSQRYKLKEDWHPREASFELNFINGTYLLCGGIADASKQEGSNLSFGYLDEGRHASEEAIKVLDGRCRKPNLKNNYSDDIPPQIYITTTPKKNWLWEYFGPIQDNDKYLAFKQNALVVTLPLEFNRENLADGYIELRRSTLTEQEARVRVDAEWEEESDTEKFVNIFWWDACIEQLPQLGDREPCILALDAAIGSETTSSLADCFAAVIITRHPNRPKQVAIRYCGIWQPEPGRYLDYKPIEEELVRIVNHYSILELAYDPTQLHDMAMRFRKGEDFIKPSGEVIKRRAVKVRAFEQGKSRLLADKGLQTKIVEKQIVHDGNPLLRQHIDNSDIKKHGSDGIRIVKRASTLKVDAAVCVSMGVDRAMYYNLG